MVKQKGQAKKVKVEREYTVPRSSPYVVDLKKQPAAHIPTAKLELPLANKPWVLTVDLKLWLAAIRSAGIFLISQIKALGCKFWSWQQKLKQRLALSERFNQANLLKRSKAVKQVVVSGWQSVKGWRFNSSAVAGWFVGIKNFIWSKPLPGWLKPLLTFTLVCLLLVLPFRLIAVVKGWQHKQGEVLGQTTQAIASLRAGTQAVADLDLVKAKISFDSAAVSFASAQKEIQGINQAVVSLAQLVTAKGKLLRAGQHLLNAGGYLSQAGAQLSVGLEAGLSFNQDQTGAASWQSVNLLTLVGNLQQNLEQSLPAIRKAKQELSRVKASSLPKDQQQNFQAVQSKLPLFETTATQAIQLLQALSLGLGQKQPQRYLLLFQNSNELRATGGFIGSLAIVDFYQGAITKLEVPPGGPYDIAGWTPVKVAAPVPLRLVNPLWSLQDANWFVDFPTSAKKINWFYAKAWSGSSIDGIITLTPEVITDLLRLTGPIAMPVYDKEINADNFVVEAQKSVELEYDKVANRPKQFIGDLMTELLNRSLKLPPEKYADLVTVLFQELRQKQILFNFNRPELQQTVSDFGWSGELAPAPRDYLLVVDTNIGGGKTNGVVDQIVNYQATVSPAGELMAKVEITRIHRGVEGELFTGIKNVSYLRVYAPQGSQLIAAGGFEPWYENMLLPLPKDCAEDSFLLEQEQRSIREEKTKTRIYEESGKTVFANWIGVEPGKSVTVSLTYKLPFKLKVGGLLAQTDDYSLVAQKQPGARPISLTTSLILPADWQVKWLNPSQKAVVSNNNQLEYQTVLTTDDYWGVVLGKRK